MNDIERLTQEIETLKGTAAKTAALMSQLNRRLAAIENPAGKLVMPTRGEIINRMEAEGESWDMAEQNLIKERTSDKTNRPD